jgi:murein DD-endopeptidase MepM/ murein hydrolase activator NlpD
LASPKTGKGYTLAFFFLFLCLPVCNAQVAGAGLPVITRLDPGDLTFRQFMLDVEGNRRRLAGIRPQLQQAAEHLTIYQYTVRENEDIFFLAARTNIPYAALVSLNRINNPRSLEAGMTLLLPSCPGIFIPANLETDLEIIVASARQNIEGAVELGINAAGISEFFLFFPGADFTPTERAFFLNSGFRFPLRQYRITSRFGIRNDPFGGHPHMHQGIDLAAPEGTEVFAVADGIVTATGFDPVFGNYIIITHSNRWTSLYGHLQTIETVLRSRVNSGTLIGRVGTTGQSTGPHLHFELRQDGRPFDPAGRLRP